MPFAKGTRRQVSLILVAALVCILTGCPTPSNGSDPVAPNVTVTSVTVSPESATVARGGRQTFTASVQGENNPDPGVTWSISPANKAAGTTISAEGVLTVAGNETLTSLTVTATSTADTGKSGSATVTVVEAVGVTGVSLGETVLTLGIGQTAALAATVVPNNATNKAVRWVSSAPGIATVDGNGLVTALAQGTTTITVTTVDGGKAASCAVTVVRAEDVVHVTGVTLDRIAQILLPEETAQLTATVAPANATNQAVTWTSSNDSVATVDGSGLVTAVDVGSALIIVTTADGGHTTTCAVTVSPVAVTGVTLNAPSFSTGIGQSPTQLTPAITPANATNKAVTWTSSNEGVATVNASGLVTPVAAGTATITVKTVDGNHTATCAVTVVTNVVSVTGVSLNLATLSLTGGQTGNLAATVAPANATNQVVTWESSDTSVATVSNGVVTASATHGGSATITVTTSDGNHTATCAVTVIIPVTGVTLSPVSLPLTVGGTYALSPTIAPAGATNSAVTWSSSNTGVATVSNGTVTAVAAGSATITVTTVDGNHTATCTVTVSNPALSGSVTITGTAWVGETLTANTSLNATSGLHYQWKRDNSNAGSDSASYALTSADMGKTITVVVTATGYTGSQTSAATAAVTKPTFTSPEALGTWLSARPANTATTPYEVVLTGAVTSLSQGSDALGKLFNALNGKFASVDLSGLTGTSIENCYSTSSRPDMDKLVSVILPSGLTSLGSSAFYYCTNLEQVGLPSGLTAIGNSAFNYCEKLALTSLPSGIITIGNSAFQSCTMLALTSLPSGLTSLGDSAFYGCTNLALTSLPSGLTSLGNSPFYGCTGLAQISFPANLPIGSSNPFAACTSIAFNVTGSGQLSASADGKMLIKNGTTIVAASGTSGSVTVPAGITTIGSGAFIRSSLTQITLPASLTAIEGSAFNYCQTLAQVNLPEGLTTIGRYAFESCYQLGQITLPASVTSIENRAFYSCYALTTVTCNATTPPALGTDAFYTSASLAIKVPSASVTAYQSATNWSTYASRISAQ